MKKIAFVARGLSKNGVRSFIETNLSKYDQDQRQNIVIFTDEKSFSSKFTQLKTVYIKSSNKLLWDNVFLLRALLKHGISEVIYTKNIIPLSHLLFSFKKTIYVLDLAFKYPKLKAYKFFDTLFMNTFLGLSLNHADRVIAISQFTKNEILKFYPKTNEKKIIVEHLAINPIFKKNTDKERINKVIKKYNLKLPFIFYCGSISPRKNILSLLKSFQSIQSQIPHQLYLLSSRNWNADKELEIIEKDKGERIRLIPNVSDEELAVFYSIADLFVYPSLYEGFGLPIKEAEACGCRVLCADIETTQELTSNAHTFNLENGNFSEEIKK